MRQNRGKKISFLPSHTLLQMAKYLGIHNIHSIHDIAAEALKHLNNFKLN